MGQCQMRNERISIYCHTQNNGTCDLFDYESIAHQKQQFTIQNQDSYIIRNEEVLQLIHQIPNENSEVLLFVTAKNTIVPGTLQQQGNSTALTNTQFPYKLKKNWLTVRSVNKYPLNVNDIFRLGKMTFRISSLSFNPDKEPEVLNHSKADSNEQCRICLGNTQSSNPLLNPCKCSGSLKYIHLECMKRWLKEFTSASRSSEKSETYLWNQLKCEICKESYKVIFQSDGVTYHMLELLKPRFPYVMLEFYSKKKETQVNQINLGDRFTSKSDGVIVISLGQKMSLGRARENWVKLCEASVSRFHATLQIEKIQQQDSLFLFDNNSKYGTLVQIKEDLQIYQELEVQVGKSLFKLQTSNITC
ncbi:unnamed protein product [Paramecium pentaurelia]|uniref:Uncharacterized protein n=1 Tax=Paramecium pentaurelia TaxID=43138 RepID=A0A8S1TJN7_9CILI|nr:unnamed protein product [Paramecium pentaurelia]